MKPFSLVALSHVVGVASALAIALYGPRIMDAAVCAFGMRPVSGATTCGLVSAGLGESGMGVTWAVAPYLVLLVGIMEATVWLRRRYAAQAWHPPLLVLAGCLAVQFGIATLCDLKLADAAVIALVLGTPVALVFTAYWVPLSLIRQRRAAHL